MKYLLMCFGIFIGYILAHFFNVKALKHEPADWTNCAVIIGMTTIIQCGINLAFGETVMPLATLGIVAVGCFFGQLIISEFAEGDQ